MFLVVAVVGGRDMFIMCPKPCVQQEAAVDKYVDLCRKSMKISTLSTACRKIIKIFTVYPQLSMVIHRKMWITTNFYF